MDDGDRRFFLLECCSIGQLAVGAGRLEAGVGQLAAGAGRLLPAGGWQVTGRRDDAGCG